MRLGCSSTGSERMSAATSSAVFHLASWDRRFWPAHTLQKQVGSADVGHRWYAAPGCQASVKHAARRQIAIRAAATAAAHLVWMILRNSWPVRGLKMKMAPLMGFVVWQGGRGGGSGRECGPEQGLGHAKSTAPQALEECCWVLQKRSGSAGPAGSCPRGSPGCPQRSCEWSRGTHWCHPRTC